MAKSSKRCIGERHRGGLTAALVRERPVMRSVVAALLLAFGALALLALPREARAEAPIEVYQVQCMAELDVLEIRLLDLADETKRQLIARNDKAYAKARGLFVPALYSHLDLDPADPRYGIEAETFECDMLSGHAVLTAVPEPVEGYAISAAVTITRDRYLLVDDVPFRHCAGGSPLTGLTYADHAEDRIKLAGRFADSDLDDPWQTASSKHIRKEIEPVLRSKGVGYYGAKDQSEYQQQAETCRYAGPGAPSSRLLRLKTGHPTPASAPARDMKKLEKALWDRHGHRKRWDVDRLYQIVCLPDLDFFEVRQLDFSGFDTPRRTDRGKKTNPAKRYNLYAPEWFADTAYLWGPSYKDAPESYGIRPANFECSLRFGPAILTVLPEPFGRDELSIAVTLRVAGRLLVNDQEFEACGIFRNALSYRDVDRMLKIEGLFGRRVDNYRIAAPHDPFGTTALRFVVEDAGLRIAFQTPRGSPQLEGLIDHLGEDLRPSRSRSECRYGGPGAPPWRRWDY